MRRETDVSTIRAGMMFMIVAFIIACMGSKM